MNFKRLLASVSVLASFGALSVAALPAQAAGTQKVTFYISPPLVEGSYLNSGGDVSIENFDAGCTTTWAMGTITPSCNANDPGTYGGAVTESSTPVTTTGATGTKYLGIPSGNSVTLTLTTASRYVGFWWSGGDANNTIDFYKGDIKLITMTTADIETALANSTLSAQDNSVYNTYQYYGNPNIAVAANDGQKSGLSPFAYVHLMIGGGASFDKIVMSQVGVVGGFELDNFLTKVSLPNVDSSLIKVSETPLENEDPDAPAAAEPELADTGAGNGVAGMLALIAVLSGASAVFASRKLSN